MSADLLRNLTLAVPVLAVVLLLVLRQYAVLPRRPGDLPTAGLATTYAWLGVLAVEQATDLWSFDAGPTTFLGMPPETSLGWALAWGTLPVLAGGRPVLWWGGLAWVDLLVVPRLEPLVVLGRGWLAGEALLLALVAGPALLLGHASRERTLLPVRVLLQMATATGLVLWLVPTLAFAHGPGSWPAVVDHPLPVRTALLMAGVALGVPVLAAVAELARVGRGTPYPWDPPERLVTTGPYAYLANPMQVGAAGTLTLLALAAGSPLLLGGALLAVVFSVVVAAPHERSTMSGWPGYADYRRAVPGWLPRATPYVAAPARLWVSDECGICRATGDAVAAMRPVALEVCAAEEAGVPLTRMQWDGDGATDRGVAALARALEQTGLGRAWCGWLLRLPVVRTAVQVVADACGLGPRAVTPRAAPGAGVREDVAT